MKIAIIAVPYDAGRRNVGVGCGPARLLDAGIAKQLRELGHDVRQASVELPVHTPAHEMARSVAVQRELAHEVHAAVTRDELPIVLAGNCSTAVGTLAARPAGTAVVWFDAHGDFNTAETTTSGMLDGLALSMVTGRALRSLTASVHGFVPVEEERVILIGARDLDPLEEAALSASRVQQIGTARARTAVGAAVRALARPVPPVYIHLDLDVIDPTCARANQYAAPGGFTPEALIATLASVTEAAPLYALAITAYDPSWDTDGRARQVAIDVIHALAPRLDFGE
jgi:arginase